MGFYDLSKQEREERVREIYFALKEDLENGKNKHFLEYFSDEDTYIRKAAYQGVGRIFHYLQNLRNSILNQLQLLQMHEDFRVRQTVINAAGEIGKTDFGLVQSFFDEGLFDEHHSPRNAVIGSIKKMGEVNPLPVLEWCKTYLHHEDKEIRREICHGIELRGRTHPQDVLPLLRELEFDETKRVSKTLVHVLGQVAYKKGCLETVLADLQHWKNKKLVEEALAEIIDVHHRYRNFSFYTQDQAIKIIEAQKFFL